MEGFIITLAQIWTEGKHETFYKKERDQCALNLGYEYFKVEEHISSPSFSVQFSLSIFRSQSCGTSNLYYCSRKEKLGTGTTSWWWWCWEGREQGGDFCSFCPMGKQTLLPLCNLQEHRGLAKYAFREITFSFTPLGKHL